MNPTVPCMNVQLYMANGTIVTVDLQLRSDNPSPSGSLVTAIKPKTRNKI